MGGIAVNLTATNVTVENICITNWGVGILGAWNNNTITNNVLTANDEAIVVYGDDEIVRQNDISNSTIAIFIDGGSQKEDNELVKLNQITANTQAFDITNSNGVTITANNVANKDAILALGQISGGVVVW
jgi:phage gp45-like